MTDRWRERHLHQIFDGHPEERRAIRQSLALAAYFFIALIVAIFYLVTTHEFGDGEMLAARAAEYPSHQ